MVPVRIMRALCLGTVRAVLPREKIEHREHRHDHDRAQKQRHENDGALGETDRPVWCEDRDFSAVRVAKQRERCHYAYSKKGERYRAAHYVY